jgi:hypothetical protein
VGAGSLSQVQQAVAPKIADCSLLNWQSKANLSFIKDFKLILSSQIILCRCYWFPVSKRQGSDWYFSSMVVTDFGCHSFWVDRR